MGEQNTASKSLPIVAVHPYFVWEYYPDEEATFPADYGSRFDALIQQYEGAVITLEGLDVLRQTVNRYRSLGRLENRYVIATKPADSAVQGIDWQDFCAFLRQFSEKRLKLAGGYFWEDFNDPDGRPGCLGKTAHKLKDAGFETEIMPELVYR